MGLAPTFATMRVMRVARLVLLLGMGIGCFAENAVSQETLRGKLAQQGGQPAIETADHGRVALEGDRETKLVLNDTRLAGADIQVKGKFIGPGKSTQAKFQVDAIHTRAVHVHKNGKALTVTYWCDVCAIRTYTPGKCLCCQDETELDLRPEDQL